MYQSYLNNVFIKIRNGVTFGKRMLESFLPDTATDLLSAFRSSKPGAHL